MNCIIISASGKETFTVEQLKNLELTGDVHFYAQKEPLSEQVFISLVQNFEVIALTRRPLKDLGKNILEHLPVLKGLAVYSTGYEWIDTEYLRKRNIVLSYLPDYCTITVAEHTVGMLLSLSRRFMLSSDYACQRIDRSISLRGFDLFGKKVGIIGYGKIGERAAGLLQSFGVEIIWYDKQKECAGSSWSTPLGTVLKESDIIILTASKQRGEAPLIGSEQLAVMKQGVVVVNSSRSDLVDNQAMIIALKSKKVFSYAVDDVVPELQVEGVEPGRVFQTSHTAWYSTEAIARGTQSWVENIICLLKDSPVNIAG